MDEFKFDMFRISLKSLKQCIKGEKVFWKTNVASESFENRPASKTKVEYLKIALGNGADIKIVSKSIAIIKDGFRVGKGGADFVLVAADQKIFEIAHKLKK